MEDVANVARHCEGRRVREGQGGAGRGWPVCRRGGGCWQGRAGSGGLDKRGEGGAGVLGTSGTWPKGCNRLRVKNSLCTERICGQSLKGSGQRLGGSGQILCFVGKKLGKKKCNIVSPFRQ